MSACFDALERSGIRFLEYGSTAIDAYRRIGPAPLKFVVVEAGIVELAKALDPLEFPGLPYADAAIREAGAAEPAIRFLCVDSLEATGLGAGLAADFRRDPRSGFFHDPTGIYPLLRKGNYPAVDPSRPGALFEAAILAARAGDAENEPPPEAYARPGSVSAQQQKDLLTLILTGPRPERGLDFLLRTGFAAEWWPELAALASVDHAKDHHPEGGGWAHTMETFSHRKTADLTLSLALLLHDTGKARSVSAEGRRFDKHAEIGAFIASKFLARLDFDADTIRDVTYMIRSHMLPAALPRLPLFRVGEVVADPRFPLLLELYRCDEFSTFRGPEGYYDACAAYKAYLKNRKNPYRDDEGRKLGSNHMRMGD